MELFCLKVKALLAEGVKYVVLDEADKMLSLGLEPQLKRLRRLLVPSKSAAKFAGPLLAAPLRSRPQVCPFCPCCLL